jgi:hypothetical protein
VGVWYLAQVDLWTNEAEAVEQRKKFTQQVEKTVKSMLEPKLEEWREEQVRCRCDQRTCTALHCTALHCTALHYTTLCVTSVCPPAGGLDCVDEGR